jgi:hypothetical protein
LSTVVLAGSAWAQTSSFTSSYTGQGVASTTCNTSFNINGQEPTSGKHPVFLYMVGTTETSTNASASAAVAGMASRGFVAATIAYDSNEFGNCGQISGKASCIFNPNSATSAVAELCSRASADCSKGIVVGGFSQGAVIGTLAKNFDSRVQATYGMGDGVSYTQTFNLSACMANGNRTLHSDRLRAVNGDQDMFTGNTEAAQQTNMQSLTGFVCPAGATSCLQSNGSGWIIVQDKQVQDGQADHCYMRASGGCFGNQNSLDAGWQNGADNWELNANLNWLAGFATP